MSQQKRSSMDETEPSLSSNTTNTADIRASLSATLERSGSLDVGSSYDSGDDAGGTFGSFGGSWDSAEGDRPDAWGPSSWGSADPGTSPQMPEMVLQRAPAQPRAVLEYMEAEPGAELVMRSQAFEDAEKAKTATLPPLQSILELTNAHVMPQRQGTADADAAVLREASVAGHLLQDGAGTLPDGSTYERLSGEEMGNNGYWCRWWVLRGTSSAGNVEWEERWWEASDWSGLREMGAEKSGVNARGDAWREFWKEKVYYRAGSGEPCVERDAHKWAHNAGGEEWEEKWGEFYSAGGHINKWADKWGKAGSEVWHEKWGEEYEGGRSCNKWTDRWAETLLPDGRQEARGDKWAEKFSDGKGSKTGENWYQGANGHRYHRTWGENHFGDGWVQKYGHSTEGDHWDTTEQTGTHYNPISHFNFKMALDHSPTLMSVPVRPRESTEEDLLDGGLSNF